MQILKRLIRSKFILILLVIFSFTSSLLAQSNSFTFKGFFNGSNLIVQCREAQNEPWIRCACFDSIAVNGKVIPDILYDGFQIDLANKTDLMIQDTVEIVIYHENECDFRISNPNDFLPAEILGVDYLLIDEAGTLMWAVLQNYPQLHLWVQIEQYKWGEWVKIGPNINITEKTSYQFSVIEYLVRGNNQFRVVVASINQDRVPSSSVFIKHKAKKVKFKFNKKTKLLKFSAPTHYEVWDNSWLIAAKGLADEVDLSGLAKGNYHLRYANRIKRIIVK